MSGDGGLIQRGQVVRSTAAGRVRWGSYQPTRKKSHDALLRELNTIPFNDLYHEKGARRQNVHGTLS